MSPKAKYCRSYKCTNPKIEVTLAMSLNSFTDNTFSHCSGGDKKIASIDVSAVVAIVSRQRGLAAGGRRVGRGVLLAADRGVAAHAR